MATTEIGWPSLPSKREGKQKIEKMKKQKKLYSESRVEEPWMARK